MVFNVIDGINIYKNLLLNNNTLSGMINITASGELVAGSITTSSGNISSYSGNKQTREGTVGGKNGSFQNHSCTGLKTLTASESRRIYMGLDSDAASGIDICADTNQYIDITVCSDVCKKQF